MMFTTVAMPPAQFNQWVATARAQGSALDDSAYLLLLRQSQNLRPYTYRTVAAGLFERVVKHSLPTGPGPALNGPGGAIRPVGGR